MHKFSKRLSKLEVINADAHFLIMLFKPHSLDSFYKQLESIGKSKHSYGVAILFDDMGIVSPKEINYDPNNINQFEEQLNQYQELLI